jgi:RNA polymerase sigma-70 factor (ECF subfamily)
MGDMALHRDRVVHLLLGQRAKILAHIWSIVRDRHAAEDLFQELSILAIDRCAEIESDRHFMGWVRTAARWKALRWRERQRRQAAALDDEVLELLDGHWQAFDDTPARDLAEALRACLDRLTPNARRLVDLKYVDELAGATIAQRLGQGVRSVYTALSRVHRALSECLQQKMPQGGAADV